MKRRTLTRLITALTLAAACAQPTWAQGKGLVGIAMPTKTYNNGVKVVPRFLLKPVAPDATNWKQVLVDSGYYKENQIK